jgi:hypothetical protein
MGAKVRIHAACKTFTSGQLLFLGLKKATQKIYGSWSTERSFSLGRHSRLFFWALPTTAF